MAGFTLILAVGMRGDPGCCAELAMRRTRRLKFVTAAEGALDDGDRVLIAVLGIVPATAEPPTVRGGMVTLQVTGLAERPVTG